LTGRARIEAPTVRPSAMTRPSMSDCRSMSTTTIAYVATLPRVCTRTAKTSPIRIVSLATDETTSPVGSSLVMLWPDRATVRVTSCEVRKAACIHAVMSQRWPIAFEAIHTTPTPAMTTAQVHVVRLRPDSVALSMMWPTRYGWNELHVKPSTPKNMAPASTWACLRASHSRSVTGPRSGGVPGSAKGRERTTTTVRTTTDTDPRFIHRPAAAGREGARNGLSSRGEYPADRTRDLRRGGGHRDPQGARRDVPLPLHGARHRRHAAHPLRRARHQV